MRISEVQADDRFAEQIVYGVFFCGKFGQESLNGLVDRLPLEAELLQRKTGIVDCGINFDTANLILYGNGNSLDAVGMFGKYIRDTHIKDGFYPEDGFHNGRQMPVGEGCANIPAIIKKLREIGYDGPFTIEREISGEQQQKDIAATREKNT